MVRSGDPLLLLCLGACLGCVRAVYPPASADAARSSTRPSVALETQPPSPPGPRCDPEVPLISRQIADARAYDVIDRVSVTCGVGIAQSCDDLLRARACALGADAVVPMEDAGVGSSVPTESALMIRWKSIDAGMR